MVQIPRITKMVKLLLLFTAGLISCSNPIHGARILAVLPIFGRSHHSVFQPILKTLVKAGHQVVVYSPFPIDPPYQNYTDIHLKNIPTNGSEVNSFILDLIGRPHFRCMENTKIAFDMFNQFVDNEEIKKLIKSKEKFDLIISEVYTVQEFTLILSHVFKAPVIALQAFQPHCILNRNSGNSLSIAHLPDVCHPFSSRMTIMERFYNSFWVLKNLNTYYNEYLPAMESLMKQHFPDMPPLSDLMENVALTFFNGHRTAFYPVPLPPNMIPIGGIHLDPEKPLPQDFATFLDGASGGFIYFSLGTYIPDELMPQEYFDKYINVFKKLQQRILWKTRKEAIEGLSSNVMLAKWVPQQDVLAHPNCVLFVTHGGQLSQIEAIHYGIPVVSVPYIFDQHRNAKFYEAAEIGVKLNFHELTTETILGAIQTVLKTPKYRENMKKLSSVFKDTPMSPADSVVFWSEYVLRHGGARHLRPASAQLPLYQLVLLDVLAVLFSGIAFLVLVLYVIISKFVVKLKKITVTKSVLSKKLN